MKYVLQKISACSNTVECGLRNLKVGDIHRPVNSELNYAFSLAATWNDRDITCTCKYKVVEVGE